MFCLCAALAICCETFRTTVLQTSKAPNHTDMTLREAEGILLTRACLPGPPWALSVSSSPRPDDSCLLPGEGRVGCVWLKMSLLRGVGNEDRKSTASHLYWTRSPDTYGKCQDCHCSWFFGFFFLMLHRTSGHAPEHVFTARFWKILNHNPECNC